MPRTPLQTIPANYRASSQTEREKGSYFRFEASYADLYSDVWLFADWAKAIGTPEFGIGAKDTGIDLVAKWHEALHMSVNFSTYQSLEVLSPTQFSRN